MGKAERDVLNDVFSATIYALVDPRTDAIRYVGVTGQPDRRFTQHLQDAAPIGTRRQRWLYELVSAGLKPEFRVLAETVWTERWKEEQQHIRRLRDAGAELLNGEPSIAATAVDLDVLNRFRQAVMKRHGKVRGTMKEEATRALEDRIEQLEQEN